MITVGGIPYRCPPAPLELTFLLEEWLRKRGLRSPRLRRQIELHYLYPLPRVFPIESVAEVATPLLEERGVKYTVFSNTEIEDSSLGDEQGWLPTDHGTLEVKSQPHVYALGDATDLPVSKSGSAAHFEAKVLAQRLMAAVRGEEPEPEKATYDGEVMCFLETGGTGPPSSCSTMSIHHAHPGPASITTWRNTSSIGPTGTLCRKG